MRSHSLLGKFQVAVIGGNGFLGRAIIHRLSGYKNLRIFSIDKRTHGVSIDTSKSKAIIQQITMDVGNEGAIQGWLAGHPVDAIIFAAGVEDITEGLGYTFKDETKALLGLENTLTAINEMNLEAEEPRPYFMYLSSWSVYGPNKLPASEGTREFPGNYAGMLKLAAEDLVKRLSSRAGAEYCIVRPTEIYGRRHYRELSNRKYWTGYLAYYVDKVVRREESLDVFSPDTLVDLVSINYFTKIIVTLLEQGATGVYNISSGSTISIKDLVSRILSKYADLSYTPTVVYKKHPKIEHMRVASDKTWSLVPYDASKYDLEKFLEDYIKVRRLEIAKAMAVESALKEKVTYDSASLEAAKALKERQLTRKVVYERIKSVAGEQFFKLGVGNIAKRYDKLKELEEPTQVNKLQNSTAPPKPKKTKRSRKGR